MDEELSTADPLAPNGGLLPSGTGNGLLKPCLFCRLALERNGRGAEYSRPAGPNGGLLPSGTGIGLLKPEKGMDEELSTADPLAPNGGLLPNGTGNGLLKPCLFYRLA